MSAHPDQHLFEAIAAELGVDPSFVEKDWHAMRLVALLAGIEHDPLRLVFSGGTSLSKGYNLIRRFSEDLDFKLVLPKGGVPRSVRSGYRRQVVQAIRATGNWTIEDTDIQVGNASQFFSCLIGYSNSFAPARGLRPQVKLEVTFSAPAFPPEKRPLRSFVAEGRKEGPEVPAIACVSPVETAADKLSALTWRVLTRQRGGARDEPALIRHLHDLAALETLASEHPEFPELLLRLLVQDAARGRAVPEIAAMTPGHRLAAALDMLAGDPDYRAEYDRFVLGMSLRAMRFRVLIVWECDVRDGTGLLKALEEFFPEAAAAKRR